MSKTAVTETAAPASRPRKWAWHTRPLPASSAFTTYALIAPAGMVADDLRNPEVFGATSATFRRRDVLDIWANDGTWFCVCRVAKATPTTVQLMFKGPGLGIAQVEPEFTASDGDDPDYAVTWRGEMDKWCCLRRRDQHVMFTGLQTQSAAMLERDRQFRGKAA